jgi:hypothetical protein
MIFCISFKYTSNIGEENGRRLQLMPGNVKQGCPTFLRWGRGDGHALLLWASSRAVGLKIILPKLFCIFPVYIIFTIYIYIYIYILTIQYVYRIYTLCITYTIYNVYTYYILYI